mgnify:FL=1
MITEGIRFLNFKKKINIKKTKQNLNLILSEKNQVIKSLSKDYKNSFKKKKIK